MQIGRKIYYELATGFPVADTGERDGDVRETTPEEDYEIYTELSKRVPDAVGMIQIPFGHDAEKFGVYPYSIQNGAIVWDTANPINPPAAEQISLQAQIDELTLALADIYANGV